MIDLMLTNCHHKINSNSKKFIKLNNDIGKMSYGVVSITKHDYSMCLCKLASYTGI